jgi:predicted DsbA family dithiol-disulfide isomerase
MSIDIYADLICPWCYIGLNRLKRALAARRLTEERARIAWVPFQLAPGLPAEGIEARHYDAARYGGEEKAAHARAIALKVATSEGLMLDFENIRRIPHTGLAHRLLLLAQRRGLVLPLAEALFAAHFRHGDDIGDAQSLVAIAAAVGMPEDVVASYLDSAEEMARLSYHELSARRMGIQAIPCFVFDQRFALAGAQEWQAFLPMLDIIGAYAAPAPAMAGGQGKICPESVSLNQYVDIIDIK